MEKILGVFVVLAPIAVLFMVVFEEERKKSKSFWSAVMGTLGQLLVAAFLLTLAAGFIYGLTHGSDSEGVCGYPYDC